MYRHSGFFASPVTFLLAPGVTARIYALVFLSIVVDGPRYRVYLYIMANQSHRIPRNAIRMFISNTTRAKLTTPEHTVSLRLNGAGPNVIAPEDWPSDRLRAMALHIELVD